MTVDRENRDRLADAVRRYLGEEITTSAFDDEIHAIRDASDDPTIRLIVGWLWYHYDDFIDHEVRLSKDEWNYFQRLLLVLASEAHVVVETRRRWSATQLAAVAALMLFGGGVAWLGLGWRLVSIAIPSLAAVSIAIAWRPGVNRPSKSESILTPFTSFAELRAVRRQVVGFAKRKYPPHVGSRRIRSPAADFAMWLPTVAIWTLCSPVVLALQVLPERQFHARVEISRR